MEGCLERGRSLKVQFECVCLLFEGSSSPITYLVVMRSSKPPVRLPEQEEKKEEEEEEEKEEKGKGREGGGREGNRGHKYGYQGL